MGEKKEIAIKLEKDGRTKSEVWDSQEIQFAAEGFFISFTSALNKENHY